MPLIARPVNCLRAPALGRYLTGGTSSAGCVAIFDCPVQLEFFLFLASINKGLRDHLVVVAFINANPASTGTKDLPFIDLEFIYFFNSGLVTAQELSLTEFDILPEFPFASGTFNSQHT